jgi:hypothetical protein
MASATDDRPARAASTTAQVFTAFAGGDQFHRQTLRSTQ